MKKEMLLKSNAKCTKRVSLVHLNKMKIDIGDFPLSITEKEKMLR